MVVFFIFWCGWASSGSRLSLLNFSVDLYQNYKIRLRFACLNPAHPPSLWSAGGSTEVFANDRQWCEVGVWSQGAQVTVLETDVWHVHLSVRASSLEDALGCRFPTEVSSLDCVKWMLLICLSVEKALPASRHYFVLLVVVGEWFTIQWDCDLMLS